MLSENDKKYLVVIEKLVKQCLSKSNDFYSIRSTFAGLVYVYDKLDDKGLKTIFENRSKEICVATDSNKIREYLKEFLVVINDKKRSENKKFIVIDRNRVERSPQYGVDRSKYSDKKIKELEEKILNSPVYQEHLHAPIKSKIWGENCRHARLTNNLRTIYIYVPKKKFEFVAIVTHNELDKI